MGKIETATQWMIDLANDDSHGYDQDSRWGPDYDCSSSVISAWQYAGVPVKTKGASSTYDMKNVFLSCGFTNVISSVNVSTGAGLKRGDVLHRSGHTAMYIGNNKQVAAHLNEKGTTKGGKTGDQTGKEISVSAYSIPVLTHGLLFFVTQPKLKRLLLSQPQRPANGFREVTANGGIDILTVLVRKVTGN